jgi:uncharacterized caspase-like protein
MTFFYRTAAVLAVLCLFTTVFAIPGNAQAPERRFALVIGNSEYRAGKQPTAANDAGLVAETLRSAGFDVSGARDLDQDTIRRSMREFLDKVAAAGPQAVTFVYLAGYGLQFEGDNYIVPVDAAIRRDEDIPIEAIRISDLTRALGGTPGGVKLFVVDAARQHPFTPAGTPLASGLALVEPDPGMLIAFNAAPGSIAPVENGPYGAFAQSLAEMIGTGGLSLDDLFARLRLRVNEKTNGLEVPWYAAKITQPFLFMERTPDAPPPPQAVASMQLQSQPIREFRGDQEAYVAAVGRDTLGGYEEFMGAFPDSPLAPRVRALIAVRREAITWRRTVSINTPEAYWSYLRRYPQGAHVADCERRLSRLSAAFEPPPSFALMAYDVPPPPPDEVVYLRQPVIVFDGPGFLPPPPIPAFFLPPPPPAFLVLAPPPPPIGAFFLPSPILPVVGVGFFARPPAFVVAPPSPPVQQITINNTTIINNGGGGGPGAGRAAAPAAPALPAAVATAANSGAIKPAVTTAPPPTINKAALTGTATLGNTTTQMPVLQKPSVATATATPGAQQGVQRPGGPATATTPGTPPAALVSPTTPRPGGPATATTTPGTPPAALVSPTTPRPGGPATATTTPGTPPAAPGAARPGPPTVTATPGPPSAAPVAPTTPRGPATATTTPGTPPAAAVAPAAPHPGGPATAATTPGVPPAAAVTPGGPHPAGPTTATPGTPPGSSPAGRTPGGRRPTGPATTATTTPAPAATPPAPAAPHVTPPAAAAPPPPKAPQVVSRPPSPPPVHAAPPPPPAVHTPPPPPAARAPAPPPPQAAARPTPPGAKKCVVENGKQVCK